jgi:hypothetical protein
VIYFQSVRSLYEIESYRGKALDGDFEEDGGAPLPLTAFESGKAATGIFLASELW